MTTVLVPTTVETEPVVERKRRSLPKPSFVLACLWLGGLTFLALFADFLPFIRGYDQSGGREAARYRIGPGWDYWFGSDKLGRDVFARCIYGAQKSLTIAVTSILVGLIAGGALGITAGYLKRWVDRGLSILFDILL